VFASITSLLLDHRRDVTPLAWVKMADRVHQGLLMAKRPAQAVWNNHGWNNAFWSWNCVLAASSCGCTVASSRHPWNVQISWAAMRAVQLAACSRLPCIKKGSVKWPALDSFNHLQKALKGYLQ
jgi:hypothetical protein